VAGDVKASATDGEAGRKVGREERGVTLTALIQIGWFSRAAASSQCRLMQQKLNIEWNYEQRERRRREKKEAEPPGSVSVNRLPTSLP
jgi:hypothetical protein